MTSGNVSDENAAGLVSSISPLTVNPIDDKIKDRAARDKSSVLKTVVAAWKDQQKEERTMRGNYARLLLWALFSQIFLVNIAFFLLGFGCLKVDEWTARVFIMAVFGEISGMVFFIVKYLFAKGDDGIMKLIEKL